MCAGCKEVQFLVDALMVQSFQVMSAYEGLTHAPTLSDFGYGAAGDECLV